MCVCVFVQAPLHVRALANCVCQSWRFSPISCSQFPWQHLKSTDVGERGRELRQLSWWRVLKKEAPRMMSVKWCEPWNETEWEADACVVNERACLRACLCVYEQVSCIEALWLWLSIPHTWNCYIITGCNTNSKQNMYCADEQYSMYTNLNWIFLFWVIASERVNRNL